MKEVVRQINALCKGTDKALAALKATHAGNAAVMARLAEYENEIEARGNGGDQQHKANWPRRQ